MLRADEAVHAHVQLLPSSLRFIYSAEWSQGKVRVPRGLRLLIMVNGGKFLQGGVLNADLLDVHRYKNWPEVLSCWWLTWMNQNHEQQLNYEPRVLLQHDRCVVYKRLSLLLRESPGIRWFLFFTARISQSMVFVTINQFNVCMYVGATKSRLDAPESRAMPWKAALNMLVYDANQAKPRTPPPQLNYEPRVLYRYSRIYML